MIMFVNYLLRKVLGGIWSILYGLALYMLLFLPCYFFTVHVVIPFVKGNMIGFSNL